MSDTLATRHESLDRRAFLAAAASGLAVMRGAGAQDETPKPSGIQTYPGLIVRQHEPANLESPFAALDSFLTPTNLFYVRSHFPTPTIDVKEWRLKVEGAVRTPLELSFDDLHKLKPRTLTATLECSGNGRVFLVPKAAGVPWELGAVSNAEWTGVPLAAVLEKAGLQDGAVEVVLEGADSGEIKDDPKSPGVVHFARGLPLKKARDGDVLLAHRMNGAALTAAHGYPVRAVVPGWYGMASIKWLRRIVVTETPFQGFFQTMQYSYFERRDGLPTLVPGGELEVKSQIARPARGEEVPAGSTYRIRGTAWTGQGEIARVEVSTNDGKTWEPARLKGEAVPYAWRLWEYEWKVPKKGGSHRVVARATDSRGRTQPKERDPGRRTYAISHLVPVEVEVR